MSDRYGRREEDRRFGPRRGLWKRIVDVALMDVGVLLKGVDEASLETFEERLLEADFGVQATLFLVDALETEAKKGRIKTSDDFRALLVDRIEELLTSNGDVGADLAAAVKGPTVILIVGVNGVGKTTTAARLVRHLEAEGRTALLAAADTFRAGAIEQIGVWAERLGVSVVSGAPGGDPAAVVYDAIEAAAARGIDDVVADTAGRLHTQRDLMDELEKVVRVTETRLGRPPDEVLLCLDATTGQNAVSQARVFGDRLPISGIVVTKVDGTARGGVLVAVRQTLDVPIKFVGLGEGPDDLIAFDPRRFAEGLVR